MKCLRLFHKKHMNSTLNSIMSLRYFRPVFPLCCINRYLKTKFFLFFWSLMKYPFFFVDNTHFWRAFLQSKSFWSCKNCRKKYLVMPSLRGKTHLFCFTGISRQQIGLLNLLRLVWKKSGSVLRLCLKQCSPMMTGKGPCFKCFSFSLLSFPSICFPEELCRFVDAKFGRTPNLSRV